MPIEAVLQLRPLHEVGSPRPLDGHVHLRGVQMEFICQLKIRGPLTTLTSGTSDGVYTPTGSISLTAGDYYGFAFSTGTCATAPTFDITATLR